MGSQGWVIESGEVSRNGDLLTVVGSAYFGGNWIVPALRSYRLSSGQWREVQRIDSEYESAIRNPAFLRGHTGIDDRVVVVYTRRYPSNLSQPHVGPLLNFAERWCRRGDQYVVEPAHEIPSPLGTLNVLVGAVKSGDHRLFDAYAPRRLRYRLWRIIEDEPGEVDVTTVSNVVYDDAKTLVLRDSGVRVRFRKVGRAFLPVRVD